MKSMSKVLTGITVVVLIFLTYLLYGSRLRVSLVDVQTQPCAERATDFDNAVMAARLGDGGAVAYASEAPGEANDYLFLTLTYEATNIGLLPAEWLSIDVVPEQGDVLKVGGHWPDVPGLSKSYLSVTIVTPAGEPASGREAYLRYYAAGRPITITASGG